DIIWATIVSSSTKSIETVWINLEDKYKLKISMIPWKLPLKYDIAIDREVVEAMPFKFQFTLQISVSL
ncbi:hypothetical protein BGZ49_004984, partial [Haplosporangium sp. Z 27]